MIIVDLVGGLGNQLFQYAAGLNISLKYNSSLYIGLDSMDGYQVWPNSMAAITKSNYIRKYRDLLVVDETAFSYNPIIPPTNQDFVLKGYFQSPKYFEECADDVINLFRSRLRLHRHPALNYDCVEKSNSLFIHLRRGDYLNESAIEFHGIVEIDDVVEMVCQLDNEHKYDQIYGFSDDPHILSIVNDKLSFNKKFIDTTNLRLTNLQALSLMLSIKDCIIANSTYSWWGAFLGVHTQKNVYRPKSWFKASYKTDDMFPSDWMSY
jgi:hypothetical protein